jgi:chitinase
MFKSLAGLSALLSCTLFAFAEPPETRVVNGYFVEWGIYGGPTPFFVKNLVLNGDAERLTQISYAFGTIINGQCGLADSWADVQRPFTANESVSGAGDSTGPTVLHGNFNQLLELKQRYPRLKVVMSLGGGGVATPFSEAAATPASRKAFAASCISTFIKGNFGNGVAATPGIFDGIDIDWEYPVATDTANLVELVKEFRKQLDQVRPGLLLTMASPAGSWAYQNIDLPGTAKYLDFYDVMTYDFAGPWQTATGFVAPLYQTQFDPDPTNNADATISAYLAAGVPAHKIVMGIPFYGYGWTVSGDLQNGQFVVGTPVDQGEAYSYVAGLMPTFKEYRAEPGRTPFLFNGTQFWTYEDPESIRVKTDYIRDRHLRGAMVWELGQDLPDGKLLHTLAKGIREER